ncbi:SDR family NAD(P)-dependent oxidoreductase [Natronosporangium hydrolyticum]|nr:SDR family NAD(P)-dependent oxidoreductase [Natronosporangium hydrolyticum]
MKPDPAPEPAPDPAAALPTAVVTGATAGIGAAFARLLAAESYRLVLVARDADRLRAVAAELAPAPVTVLPADLATEAGVAAVAERLAADPPELLINNAGISLNRSFLDSDPAAEERLLRLNVHAVMRLTLAVVPGMAARGHGGVVNVSSVAGFTVPRAGSTYSAGKAWVTNFSQSIGYAVRPHGVRVMALCPGLVRTEFHQRAGIDLSRTSDRWWLTPDHVAADGLRSLRRGRIVRVVDWRYRILVALLRVAPGALVRAISRGGAASRQPPRTL